MQMRSATHIAAAGENSVANLGRSSGLGGEGNVVAKVAANINLRRGRRGSVSPPHNVGPITGRAGAEPRSTNDNYTAGPVRCIGGLVSLGVERDYEVVNHHAQREGDSEDVCQ
jgi:hypothetical protein